MTRTPWTGWRRVLARREAAAGAPAAGRAPPGSCRAPSPKRCCARPGSARWRWPWVNRRRVCVGLPARGAPAGPGEQVTPDFVRAAATLAADGTALHHSGAGGTKPWRYWPERPCFDRERLHFPPKNGTINRTIQKRRRRNENKGLRQGSPFVYGGLPP